MMKPMEINTIPLFFFRCISMLFFIIYRKLDLIWHISTVFGTFLRVIKTTVIALKFLFGKSKCFYTHYSQKKPQKTDEKKINKAINLTETICYNCLKWTMFLIKTSVNETMHFIQFIECVYFIFLRSETYLPMFSSKVLSMLCRDSFTFAFYT